MVKIETLEAKAAEILSRFETASPSRKAPLIRPFMVELFGTPKSGKSTIKEMAKHFFRRNDWSVAAPEEGAEAVKWLKRLEPEYNFQTAEYALTQAREYAYGPIHKSYHAVLFDRAIFDGAMRMRYYADKKIITEHERRINADYFLQPCNRGLFDLHVCLVCDPEVSIKRELARALTKKHGETMNPQTLRELHAAHRSIWSDLGCKQDPKMFWHDSSNETPEQTARAVLGAITAACEDRLAGLSRRLIKPVTL